MQIFGYEFTLKKKGTLTIKNLPFDVGEKVEVIIIPRSSRQPEANRYPFWGKPITYANPTEPVAETDWEVLQ
ncbi:MAG: hypothetical protein WAS33_19130 [Candidatus Promineifilaceae bacterium]